MLKSGWKNGYPYPKIATLEGGRYILPKGFHVSNYSSTAISTKQTILDLHQNECEFRIINGQPYLISIRGVWYLFGDKYPIQTI